MSEKPSFVNKKDQIVLKLLGVGEGGIVGKVVMVGFSDVVEGGGERVGESI